VPPSSPPAPPPAGWRAASPPPPSQAAPWAQRAWSETKTPHGASPSPPPESCRAPSESPPAATANHGGSHQTAPSRPSPPSSGPSPPPAGATPTAPTAPPPQTAPPSPHTPPPSAASPPAATGPGHHPPGESWDSRHSWIHPPLASTRQGHPEMSARAPGNNGDLAAVRLDQLAGDRQPQAAAFHA